MNLLRTFVLAVALTPTCAIAQTQSAEASPPRPAGDSAKQEPARDASQAAVSRIQSLIDSGNIDAAMNACLDARKAFPGDRRFDLQHAQLLQRKGDVAGAVEEFRLLLATELKKSNRSAIAIQLARILMNANEKDEALKVYRSIVEDDPNGSLAPIARDVLARNGHARTDWPSMRLPAAQPGRGATGPANKNAASLPGKGASRAAAQSSDKFMHASQLRDTGKYIEAAAEFREVLRLNPTYPGARVEVGRCLFNCQRLKEAEAELRKAISESSWDSEAYYWLGSSIAGQQRAEEAVPFLRKSAELAPTDPMKQRVYLALLVGVRHTDEAIAASKAAVAKIPGDATIRECLADALQQKGDYEAAVREYRQSIAENRTPGYEQQLMISLGKTLWKMGKKAEARSELQEVIELDKGNRALGPEARRVLDSWK